MVNGIDKFREVFSSFSDKYIIIGGTACDIVLSETEMLPRVTTDIDIVLIFEKMTPEFANAFWQFIRDGGYKPDKRQRNSDGEIVYTLYRFKEPYSGYPIKIELLSRHPEILGEPKDIRITPIPIEDDISSLSAIVLDDNYYEFTVDNSIVEDGLRVASPTALVVLKAKAYLNLIKEREQGRSVNTKDIKKHRSDVLKLSATSLSGGPVPVNEEIYSTITEFVRIVRSQLPSQSLQDALKRTSEDIEAYLEILENFFFLNEENK